MSYLCKTNLLKSCGSIKFVFIQSIHCSSKSFIAREKASKTLKNLSIYNLRFFKSRTNDFKPRNGSQSPKEFRNLISIAKPERFNLSGAVVLLLVSSAVTMSIPWCIGQIIDMINLPPEEMKLQMTKFCQILIVVLACGAAANFGRVYLINNSSYRIINELRKRTYNSILDQEIAFFDRTKTGELMNRISSDASVVGLSVTNNISDGLRSAFSFIAGASLMLYTSPHLALVGLMTVSPVALMAVFYGRYLKNVTRNVQEALAKSSEIADERISNIRTVTAFTQQDKEKNLYANHIEKVLHFARKESLARAAFFGMSGFSGNLIALSVLYSGGLMMTDEMISIGSLSSFLMYAAYVGISIGGLTTFYAELMRGLGASTRLWELINRNPSISLTSGITLPKLVGDVEFKNISFAYPSRPNVVVLSNFSLQIPAGIVYAVVGPSGSGKSTLGMLLLRCYDCLQGQVSVDGNDIKSLSLEWLRRNVGIVSQEPVLFSCSVRENVLYGASNDNISEELLNEALSNANALEFVERFPEGLDTIVGEKGTLLSGGQRQRIAIARALLKNPRILILDEATSALDTESELLVQGALENLMKDRTVITIAHRLSTIRKADRIGVLNRGQLVEEGTYAQLLDLRGLFYRLVQHQNLS